MIIYTLIHLRDFKGWERIEKVEGDIHKSRWFIRKRVCSRDIHYPITKCCQPDYPNGESLMQKDYEFDLVDGYVQPVDEKGVELVKHLVFEQIS